MRLTICLCTVLHFSTKILLYLPLGQPEARFLESFQDVIYTTVFSNFGIDRSEPRTASFQGLDFKS